MPDRRAILSWCLYDWASSAYNTVITTFVFSIYFARGVVGDEVAGTALWSRAMAIAGIAIAILSPVLGAIADRSGQLKPWLALLTAITVAATAALWWVRPVPDDILFALTCVVIGTVAFELANVFYNASLTRVAPPAMLGRVSGWGWGTGYFGGLACLVTALFLFIQSPEPLFGLLDHTDQANVRGTSLLVAVWFGLFALPFFLWVPDAPATGRSILQSVREGLAKLGRAFRDLRDHAQTARFLVASAFYRDGINTLTAFGGLYAAGTFGMGFEEIVLFAIALNIVAGIGAMAGGWLDDALGARLTIQVGLIGLIIFATALLLVEDKNQFWWLAMGIGACYGPAQAAGRSLMARLSPPDMQTEMFGLYNLTGRMAGFLGPLALGLATEAFASQRAGMATIVGFFVLGFALMLLVREPAR